MHHLKLDRCTEQVGIVAVNFWMQCKISIQRAHVIEPCQPPFPCVTEF